MTGFLAVRRISNGMADRVFPLPQPVHGRAPLNALQRGVLAI